MKNTSLVKTEISPAPGEYVAGRATGKSWQPRLVLEEADPRLCPAASARNCLVIIPWAWFCSTPGHIISNYLQGYSQAKGYDGVGGGHRS